MFLSALLPPPPFLLEKKEILKVEVKYQENVRNYFFFKLTLIAIRGSTFHSLSVLDQIFGCEN